MSEPAEFQKLINLIRELVEKKFYGSLEIKMESGKIVICKQTSSIKF